MEDKPILFIPAGKPEKIAGEHPFNLKVNGVESILEHTVQEALKAEMSVVSTVRDCDDTQRNYWNISDVSILEAREKLVDSAIYGFFEGVVGSFLPNKFRGNWASLRDAKKYLNDNPNMLEVPVMYVGSDSPFLSASDLKDVWERYQENPSDIHIDMTDMSKLIEMDDELDLELGKLDTTLLNSAKLKEGDFRVSNVYVIKPLKVLTKGLGGAVQKLYEGRKISDGTLTSYFSMATGVSLALLGAISKPATSIALLNDYFNIRNHINGSEPLRRQSVEVIGSRLSKVTGLDVNIDTRGNLSTLLDVDDSDSYIRFRENYDVMKEYLDRKESR